MFRQIRMDYRLLVLSVACGMAWALPAPAQVKIAQGGDRLGIEIDGKPFTEFFIGAEAPKPYLHPLRSASGKVVTRFFPMSKVAGESMDHPHHRGLWFTHGEVNGWDFWGNELSQKGVGKGRGKVELNKVIEAKSGKKSGTIRASFNWLSGENKTLLTETREMTFYSDPALRIIDFDIELKAVEPVVFGDTKEGTFAIRLAPSLEEPSPKSIAEPKRTGKMVASDGKETEKQVWGKQAPWVDYFGQVEGETLGVTIMNHPNSFRYPTYWHSRGYGLFAANPFGLQDFGEKTKDGSLTLEPGKSVRFLYRVVIHPGDAQTAKVADLFKKYSSKK